MWITYVLAFIVSCVVRRKKNSGRNINVRNYLIVSAILSVLFVIAWIFALVGTDADPSRTTQEVAQYVFAVFITLHAVFLLILHTLRDVHAREVWRSIWYHVTCSTHKYTPARTYSTAGSGDRYADTELTTAGGSKSPSPDEFSAAYTKAEVVENPYTSSTAQEGMQEKKGLDEKEEPEDNEDGVATRL